MKQFFWKSYHSRAVRLSVGLIISGLSLYLVLHNVTWQEVGRALSQADPWLVGLALLSVAVNTFAKTIRWRVLLGTPGKHVTLFNLGGALLAGQMLNTLYPARIGDLSRAYVVGGMGVGRVFTLGSILVEKLVDTLAYTLLFVLLVLLIPLPAWVNGSGYTFTLAVIVASAGVFVLANRPGGAVRMLAWLTRRLPDETRSYLMARFHSGLSSLNVLQSRRGLFLLAFWTAVSWGTAILNNYLVLLALHIELPWTASLLVLIILQAGISIPSVPGKIGIFEYMCLLGLSVFGVAQAPALSFGIVLHTIVLLPTTLLGLIFFWFLGLGNRQPAWITAPDEHG